MSDKEYKTSEYVVAFIDILGATNAIMKQTDTSLDEIHKIYEEAVSTISESKKFYSDKFSQPRIKIFSDNIVVAVPYDIKHPKEDALLEVSLMSAVLQANFLAHGWLTRGGIAAGKFFIDDVMVWGPALVNAYRLESIVAYFPRVIVDPELVKESQSDIITWFVQGNTNPVYRMDEDGMFRVEIISEIWRNIAQKIYDKYKSDYIDKKLEEYHGNTKVCQKWRWIWRIIERRCDEWENYNVENATNEEKWD